MLLRDKAARAEASVVKEMKEEAVTVEEVVAMAATDVVVMVEEDAMVEEDPVAVSGNHQVLIALQLKDIER